MRKKFNYLSLGILFLLILFVGFGSAELAYNESNVIYRCGEVNATGNYTLNQTLINTTADCLTINNDSITINGNGFTVTGNVNASRSDISNVSGLCSDSFFSDRGTCEGNGGVWSGDGFDAYTNLVLNQVNINGNILSVGAEGMAAGAGGTIAINNNSNIAGAVSSAGGYSTLSSGGAGGIITISNNSNISGAITSTGGNGYSSGGSGGSIIITNSTTGAIISNGGETITLDSQAGAGGSIIITNSTTGALSSTGGFGGITGNGGSGGIITISNNSNINGTIISQGGAGGAGSGNGAAGGDVLINGSNVSGAITSVGGNGIEFGGAGGSITLTNSNVTTITSQGGDGSMMVEHTHGGNGGSITLTNSTSTTITTTGGSGSWSAGSEGGTGGSVTLTNSNATVIRSEGGNGNDSEGHGGSITLINSTALAITSIGGDTNGCGYGGNGGSITLTYSTSTDLSSVGGYSVSGDGGPINVFFSNVTGSITSTNYGGECGWGDGGLINIANSNIVGSITSSSGEAYYYYVYPGLGNGAGGPINVTSSNIVGSITSQGGNLMFTGSPYNVGGPIGGNSGLINITSSNISGIITSSGGNGNRKGGNGNSIILTNSNASGINSNGGLSYEYCNPDDSDCFGGNGGNLILNNSRVPTSSSISLLGGSGLEVNGNNGTLTLNNSGFYNEYGMIKFFNVTTQNTSISSILNIANNSVYVDSINYPDYNKSANVSFYDLAIRYNPYIRGSNGTSGICTNCYNFTKLNLANVTFNVTSWSLYNNYSIKDRIAFLNLTYSPNTTDGIDPNVTIEVNMTVPNSPDFTIEDVALQLYYNGSLSNFTMISLGNEVYNANFTLAENETGLSYTFNINATNDLGESDNYINTTFNATFDCSFSIEDSYGNSSDGDLGIIGGFNIVEILGNISLNNTGDTRFNNSAGCYITFGSDANESGWLDWAEPPAYPNLTIDYLISSTKGSLDYGVKYNKSNGDSVSTISLGPNQNETLIVSAVFTNVTSVMYEYPWFPIFANVTDTTDFEQNKTIRATMIITPGAYLDMSIDNPSTSTYTIPMKAGEYNFSAHISNVVEGADNNVAFNVTFNWSLDSSILERLISSPLPFGPRTLNNTSEIGRINFTLKLENNSYLENLTKGTKMVYVNATGFNSSGDLLPQGPISDSVAVLFECYGVRDTVCVSDCRFNSSSGVYYNTTDPDCGVCGDGNLNSENNEQCDDGNIVSGDGCSSTCQNEVRETPSSGGGGGGGGGGSFSKSEANFELVRGENQEFDLTLENKLSSPKKDISITIKGNNSQYVIPSPNVLSYLGANSKENIKFKINAPSYFSSGKYLLEITFTGTIEGNTSTKFTEVKYVTLTILEMNRVVADEYLNSSSEILSKMNSSGLYLDEVQSILNSMNSNYESLNFNLLKEEAASIELIYNSATEYLKLREELNQSMVESEKNGISTVETKKLVLLSEILFNRGDYVAAYEKLKEAKTSFLLETKGEFKLLYAIKNNPLESLAVLLSLCAVSVGSSFIFRFKMLKRQLKMLMEEESLLLQLMKVVQRDCFENNKLSMEEYNEAMYQYEARLSEVIEEKVKIETVLANLARIGGKKKALDQERERLIVLVKETQEDYLNRGKLDTRIYENMLKTYASRLAKVEEELVYLEAQEQIHNVSSFWGKLLRK